MAISDETLAVMTDKLQDCLNCQSLTDWETKFCKEQLERLDRYGVNAYLSEKQASVINRIYNEKIGGTEYTDPGDSVPF